MYNRLKLYLYQLEIIYLLRRIYLQDQYKPQIFVKMSHPEKVSGHGNQRFQAVEILLNYY